MHQLSRLLVLVPMLQLTSSTQPPPPPSCRSLVQVSVGGRGATQHRYAGQMRATARRAAPRARSGAHRRPNLPGEKVFLPLHLDNQKKTRTAACKGISDRHSVMLFGVRKPGFRRVVPPSRGAGWGRCCCWGCCCWGVGGSSREACGGTASTLYPWSALSYCGTLRLLWWVEGWTGVRDERNGSWGSCHDNMLRYRIYIAAPASQPLSAVKTESAPDPMLPDSETLAVSTLASSSPSRAPRTRGEDSDRPPPPTAAADAPAAGTGSARAE